MGHKTRLDFFLLWRVPDYIAFVVLGFTAMLVGSKVKAFCRDVDWSDPSINHPFVKKEGFPAYSLPVAVLLIMPLYAVGELLTRSSRRAGRCNMWLHINGWVLAHLWSIAFAWALVSAAKVYAGRLRPDFLARLRKKGITEVTWAAMTREEQCGATREGRLSFPSAHGCMAFAGYIPPCMYLMGLLRTLKGGRLWLVTLSLIPLILPFAVAISRTVDYRHNFDDVLAGSICGAVSGVLSVMVSFRPSRRGDWTLRDHPDDEEESAAPHQECQALDTAESAEGCTTIPQKFDGSTHNARVSFLEEDVQNRLTELEASLALKNNVARPGAASKSQRGSCGGFAPNPQQPDASVFRTTSGFYRVGEQEACHSVSSPFVIAAKGSTQRGGGYGGVTHEDRSGDRVSQGALAVASEHPIEVVIPVNENNRCT